MFYEFNPCDSKRVEQTMKEQEMEMKFTQTTRRRNN